MIPPILRDFPDQFETARLLIRAPHAGDGQAVFDAVMASKAELEPWMPWSRGDYTLEAAETYVRQAHANFIMRKDLPLLLFLRGDGAFVGGSGLHSIDWSVPSFEIGYWQRTAHTGNGYMTEAVNGITDFTRTHFHANRMIIRCDTLNTRSRAVAERAGYVLESHIHNEGREPDGELRDLFVFSKTWPD
jgi:RimJ/RimL family protein N-acetyltransferase